MDIYYKWFLLISLYFTICLSVTAQSSKIDSLETLIQNFSIKDTIYVNSLNYLVDEIQRSDLKKSKEYAEQAIALSEKLNYTKGKAEGYYGLGSYHMSTANYSECLRNTETALELFQFLNDKKGVIDCKSLIGVMYLYQSKYDLALTYFKEALDIAEKFDIKSKIPKMLNNIGNILNETGRISEAIHYYERAKVIYKENDDKIGIAGSQLNLGSMYTIRGNYLKGIELFNKALTVGEELNNQRLIFIILNNKSKIYIQLENYPKAIENIQKALSIKEKEGNKKSIAVSLNSIGEVYVKQKKYSEALDAFEKAIQITQEIQDKRQEGTSLYFIGNLYMDKEEYIFAKKYLQKALKIKLDLKDKEGVSAIYINLGTIHSFFKEYKRALPFATKALEIAKEDQLLRQQEQAYKLLSEIYSQTNNYKKAYKNHAAYKILSDSLLNKKNIQKITQLEYEYKYEKELDEAELREFRLSKEVDSTQKKLDKSQKNFFMSIMALLVITLLLGLIIFLLRFRKMKAENEAVLAEHKLLQSQMAPHFIFNALSVLQGIVLSKEYGKSVTYISKFSKLVRLILENSRKQFASLVSEFQIIENYMAIQNLSSEIPYHYTISLSDSFAVDDIQIPPMMIQPFVENIVEHAYTETHKERQIQITMDIKKDMVTCSIEDNGIGINRNLNAVERINKKSLSTTMITERLAILSKRYNANFNLSIENRPNDQEPGTVVKLNFPYKTDK